MQWTGEDVFEIDAKLGEGPHATVYKGVQAGTGALLAIKEMQVSGAEDQAKVEIEVLKEVRLFPVFVLADVLASSASMRTSCHIMGRCCRTTLCGSSWTTAMAAPSAVCLLLSLIFSPSLFPPNSVAQIC